MKCIVCGNAVAENERECPECINKENKIQVLTREERQGFSGVTLEQGGEEQTGHTYDYERINANQRIYTKQFSIGNTSFLTKVIFAIVFLGLLFVALPIVILVISIISIFLYIFRK